MFTLGGSLVDPPTHTLNTGSAAYVSLLSKGTSIYLTDIEANKADKQKFGEAVTYLCPLKSTNGVIRVMEFNFLLIEALAGIRTVQLWK